MADLNSLGDFGSDAANRDAMLEVGITQASQASKTAANRLAASAKIASSLDNTPLGTTALKVNGNPLGVGPVPAPAYLQPDTAAHPNTGATVIVENVKNPLGIVSPVPVPKYVQPGVAAPPPPVAGQLSTMSYGSIGTSGATRADGTKIF